MDKEIKDLIKKHKEELSKLEKQEEELYEEIGKINDQLSLLNKALASIKKKDDITAKKLYNQYKDTLPKPKITKPVIKQLSKSRKQLDINNRSKVERFFLNNTDFNRKPGIYKRTDHKFSFIDVITKPKLKFVIIENSAYPTIDASDVFDEFINSRYADIDQTYKLVMSIYTNHTENNYFVYNTRLFKLTNDNDLINDIEYNIAYGLIPQGEDSSTVYQLIEEVSKQDAKKSTFPIVTYEDIDTDEKTYYEFPKIVYSFIPIPEDKQSIDLSFTGKSNCFIESIKDRLPIDDYNRLKDAYPNGISWTQIKEIGHKYKFNIVIKDILNNEWEVFNIFQHKKIVNLLHHDQHVSTTFVQTVDKQEFIYNQEIGSKLSTLPYFIGYGSPRIPSSFLCDGTIYKIKDNIFINDDDFNANHDKIDMYCTNLVTRLFNHVIKIHKIEPLLSDEMSNFVRHADRSSLMCKFVDNNCSKLYLYDQTRAYANYARSRYYKIYKFPLKPSHFYRCENADQSMITSYTGFTMVDNVTIKHPFLENIKIIQDKCVYTNVLLRFLLDNDYASFTCVATAFNVENQDIDFNIEEIDGFSLHDTRFSLKQLQNSILGKLIPSGASNTKFITTKSEQECLYFRSLFKENITDIMYNNDTYTIAYKESNVSKKSYHHVHAYIIDYQMIRFLPFIMDNYENLVGVRVDGVYLNKESKRLPTDEEYIKPVEITKKLPFTKCTMEHKQYNITELSDFPNFYGCDFTHKITLIEGLGGTGKTTELTERCKLYKSCICFPTNDLRTSFSTDIPCYTYHMLFSIETAYETGYYMGYSNIIIDESSMISDDHFRQILRKLTRSQNIYVIRGIAQLEPVSGDPINWSKYPHKTITLDKIHRTADKKFISMQREAIDVSLPDKIEIFKDRIISESDMLSLYSTGDVVICSTNELVNRYNEKIMDIKDWDAIPLKYKYNSKEFSRNERKLIKLEDIPDNWDDIADVSFASTIHVVQGKTIKNKVFLINSRLWCDELFNVAMSRCDKLENFYIVNVDGKINNKKVIEEEHLDDSDVELDLELLSKCINKT